ncbi:MAG: hypothetical protein LBL18_01755, partial [Bacteroidales bacterium]|nr:hypothetical protein [Bacteroidales bacterium]
MKRNILLFLVAFAAFGCTTKKDSIPVEDLKEMLKEHALIVAQQDGTVETYDDNGIKPLFKHLEKGTFKDCYVF